MLFLYSQLFFFFFFRNRSWTLFHGKANILVLLSNVKQNHILKCCSLTEQQFLVSESWFHISLVPHWMHPNFASPLVSKLIKRQSFSSHSHSHTLSDPDFAVSHVMLPLMVSSQLFKAVGYKIELKEKMSIIVWLQNVPVMNVKKGGLEIRRTILQHERSRYYFFQYLPKAFSFSRQNSPSSLTLYS